MFKRSKSMVFTPKESKGKNPCLIEDGKIITNGVGKVASLCSEQSKFGQPTCV